VPGELEFNFDDVLEEIGAMKQIANAFLDATAPAALDALASELIAIRTNGVDHIYTWRVPDHAPIKTRISIGDYDPDSQGEHNVVAELTSIWEITPSAKPQNTRKPKTFKVMGKASTRIRIRQSGGAHDGRELCMWRAEVGSAGAPGCFFHIQVLGELADPPFPHSVSVPRFPALAITPVTALEFALGELFQDEWRREAAKEGGPRDIWKGIQRKRLLAILDWKRDLVESCMGSPWRALKCAKPAFNLFTVG